MRIIEKLPIPISGLILALFSTGNLIQPAFPSLKYIFGAVGGLFLILLILKVILYPDNVKTDLKNPIILSNSGTFSMSLMISSTYTIPFIPSIAYAIWIIGIALHILLIIYFTYHYIIQNFDINTVYPSYWIVFVGITMGAITAHLHGIHEIDFIFFIIGFISMILTLPLITYRYIKYPNIPDMNKPLICIFTALFSILIVGYLNSAQNISNEFIIGLYALACILYIFSLYKCISYRNLDFYPSFSAFTFPFVISALATNGILTEIGENIILSSISTIQTAIAVLLVVYVLIRYLIFLKNSEKSRN